MIDHIFNDSRATGGSIFLAIITSAPEVVSMFTLFKIGNIRGGISDIVGSSLFDCILLAIIEISYTSGKPFYSSPGDDVPLLVTVSLCAAIVSFIIIGLQRIFFKKRDTKLFNIIMISSLVIASLLYFVFICISIPGIEIKV
jgi:Ca2+/Na+ antiporter